MQCCIRFEIIDGYEVVICAGKRTYDPQETAKYVTIHFPGAKEEDLSRLYKENSQPAPLQANEKSVPDNTCHMFEEQLANLNSDKKLLSDGTTINDYRNKEYWIKENGRWLKDKIIQLGIDIPQGAIPIDDLHSEEYQEQREEIARQEEEDRIAALTPEQKEKELHATLDNLADEVARLEKRAQIQQKEFDPIAWYQDGEAKLYAKYGLSKETE